MKSFKLFITEMYPFPEAPKVQQVEKMEVPQNIPLMGGKSKIPEVKFEVPSDTETDCDINGICDTIRTYESAGNTEKIRKRYMDSRNLPTIGHGHLITSESPKIFAEVFPEENKKDAKWIESVLSGRTAMTDEQVEKLFQHNVRARIPKIKKMIPNFGKLSSELQRQIGSEYFRGMLPQSQKTVKFINAGQFDQAADEYLNSKEYRETSSPSSKEHGVAKRMKALHDALKKELTRQQQKKSS
jgi:GH24 family phage-related lysozyme (muramidase)